MVGRWIDPANEGTDPPAAIEEKKRPDAGGQPMNYDQALEEFDNDPTFLMEVLTEFIEHLQVQSRVLRAAVRNDDGAVIAAESHAIKGGASNLTADTLAQAAAALEKAGRTDELTGAATMLDDLEEEIRRLETFAESLEIPIPEEGL